MPPTVVVPVLPAPDPPSPATETRHIACPSSAASWRGATDQVIDIVAEAGGEYTTRWRAASAVRTAVRTTSRPACAVLACMRAVSEAEPVLVVATDDMLHFYSCGGAVFEAPLPGSVGLGFVFADVFPAVDGVVVVCRNSGGRRMFFSCMHPLEEMEAVDFGGEDVCFSSVDVGVVVTRGEGGSSVWGIGAEKVVPVFREEGEKVSEKKGGDVDMEEIRDEGKEADDAEKQDGDDYKLNSVNGLLDRVENSTVKVKEEEEERFPSRRLRMVFHKIYSLSANEFPPIAQPPSCCFSHTSSGNLVLCVVASGRLLGLHLAVGEDGQASAAERAFLIDNAQSAVGVVASRRADSSLDLLVLEKSSPKLSLYVGGQLLCNVAVVGESPSRFTELRDAVDCRLSVVSIDGSSIRVSLRNLASPSPLVCKCISTLSMAFSGSKEDRRPDLEIYSALLQSRRQDENTASAEANLDVGGRDLDWARFCSLLLDCGEQISGSLSNGFSAGNQKGANVNGNSGFEADDWKFLLGSDHHRTECFVETMTWCSSSIDVSPRPSLSPVRSGVGNGELLLSVPEFVRILEVLHLLYEDMKLCVLARSDRQRLARLNSKMALKLRASDLVDYYVRDYASVDSFLEMLGSIDGMATGPGESWRPFRGAARTPSIFEWLCRSVQFRRASPSVSSDALGRGDVVDSFPKISLCASPIPFQPNRLKPIWHDHSPLDRSEKVTRYFSILFGHAEDEDQMDDGQLSPFSCSDRPQRVLQEMCRDLFTSRELDALPFGVALPIREALWACRNSPGDDLPSAGDVLVGREDLQDLARDFSEKNGQDGTSGEEYRALLRIHASSGTFEQRVSQSSGTPVPETKPLAQNSGQENQAKYADNDDLTGDGCDVEDNVFKLRFGTDRRTSEVRRLLRSSDPVLVRLSTAPPDDSLELPEGERPNEQAWLASRLKRQLKRHLAAPIGRGAFTLRTFTPSDPTVQLPIPSICLKGNIAGQKGAKLTYNSETSPYKLDWGEFHNGAAAGLRLVSSHCSEDGQGDGVDILTRTWILNHRPAVSGENGSHAGMLFALGLGGYLPALRATDYYEYMVSMHDLTTIGLLLGVAAGNRGSHHSTISNMFWLHIRYFNAPTFSVPDFNVPLIVQSAAVLGLGLLYEGTCEHQIVEGLLAELSRRPQPGDCVQNRECLALSAGIGVGLVCLGVGNSAAVLPDLQLLDSLCLYAIGGLDPSVESDHSRTANGGVMDSHHGEAPNASAGNVGAITSSAAESETSRVRENSYVNVDVTGPGALLAIGLIFLKTNDASVAERILVPDTMYALDRARPDHVYLRCLAKHLIMWDDIETTRDWIVSTLPELLRPPDLSDEEDSGGIDLSRLRATDVDRDSIQGSPADIDEDGILFARAFAIAGTCTAVAIRFAGSANEEVIELLTSLCRSFEIVLLQQDEDSEESEWVYACCLNALVVALSIVAAGSGDLKILRLFRRIRKQSGASLRKCRYGAHMATHMAIGFLFLGGGCLTFGTSNTAIAALLCAVYPRFPAEVGDNQYHLQAMRHLYVLAVEPRCVETRDVDTDLPCSVDVEVKLKPNSKSEEGNSMYCTAPCLLPDARNVESIAVVSERYWPRVVQVKQPSSTSKYGWFSSSDRQILYVKRRTGHLPHDVDPTGSKGMLARSFGRPQGGSDNSETGLAHLVRAFSADPKMRAFVGTFCESLTSSSAVQSSSPPTAGGGGSNVERFGQIMYECLSLDKPEAMECYLDIERALVALKTPRACPISVQCLALLGEYASLRDLWGCGPLVRRDFLWHAVLAAYSILDTPESRDGMRRYVGSIDFTEVGRGSAAVGRLLQLHRVPAPSVLQNLRGAECNSEDDAWLIAGLALPADAPACAVELISRTLVDSFGVEGT